MVSAADLSPEQLLQYAIYDLQHRKEALLGPLIIAAAFGALIMGVIVAEMWWYTTTSQKNDHILLVLAVWAVFCLEFVQAGAGVALPYINLAKNFGNYEKQFDGASFGILLGVESFIGLIVQLFFLDRAVKFQNENKIFRYAITLTIVGAAASGLWGMIQLFALGTDGPEAREAIGPALITWNSLIVFSDLIVTGSLLYTLFTKKTGEARFDRNINTVLRVTCESQLPPTVFALAFLISYKLTTRDDWNIVLKFVEIKLYGFAMLHALNCRERIRDAFTAPRNIPSISVSGVADSDQSGVTDFTSCSTEKMLKTPKQLEAALPVVYSADQTQTTSEGDMGFDAFLKGNEAAAPKVRGLN